jgi:hypothetical protein
MTRVNLEDSRIERPIIVKGLKYGVTNLADANATLTVDAGPVLSIKPGAARVLTLPAATNALKGLTFIVVNGAAFTVTVNAPAATTVAIVPATVGATGTFVCVGDAASGLGVLGWTGGL